MLTPSIPVKNDATGWGCQKRYQLRTVGLRPTVIAALQKRTWKTANSESPVAWSTSTKKRGWNRLEFPRITSTGMGHFRYASCTKLLRKPISSIQT